MVGIAQRLRHDYSLSSRQGKCGRRCRELEWISMGSLAMLQVGEHPLARDQSLDNSFVRLDISESGKVLAYMEARSPYWSRFGLNNLMMVIYVRLGTRF